MRSMMLIMFVMTLAPAIGMAQTANEHRGQGYVFVAPGAVSSSGTAATLHFGVGGEGLVHKGLGIGVEIGYLGPARGLREGFGLFSANGSYHFKNASASGKLVLSFAKTSSAFSFNNLGKPDITCSNSQYENHSICKR